jgi:N6-adenosine-specific RNA methylase IME4
MIFDGLKRGHYGAILADPPWHFQVWAGQQRDGAGNMSSAKAPDYDMMKDELIAALPVAELAAENSVLFLWTCWPVLRRSFAILDAWGFTYKTCAFSWTKADARQIEMFRDDVEPFMGLGYWTRANTEPCLLATRGQPKRLNADIRQAIIAPKREHSRKPEGVHASIERLVAGPYLELFARQRRPGWDVWGNEVDKFAQRDDYDATDDFARSIDEAYRVIRERKANGGPGWTPP